MSEIEKEPEINNLPQENKWTTLSQKVYELELLISGAGIYLFSNLPYFLDGLWQYYEYNFLGNEEVIKSLANIVHVSLKSSAYLLWISFISHFVLRAFWVSMIGLMNVFPEGIRYDNLPKKYSEGYKDFLKKKISPHTEFMLQLDKICSNVLSVTFFFVLNLFLVSVLYVLIIVISETLKYIFNITNEIQFIIVFLLSTLLIILTPVIFVFIKYIFNRNERLTSLKYKLSWASKNFIFWGITVQRLTLTYRTHLSKTNANLVMFGIIFAFSIFSAIMNEDMSKLFTGTYFYPTNSEMYSPTEMYENIRNPEKYVKKISFQSEVITQKQAKIFIAYPKILESHFEENLVFPKRGKKEDKVEYIQKKQKIALAFWQKFFKIYINDSLYTNLELVFQEHPTNKAKGFGGYLQFKHLKKGKNTFVLKIPEKLNKKKNSKDSTKKDIIWAEFPFWYLPNN
ncbi:MAG: hypothetical protein EAZ06_11190 [Cytophagales bacterium]|nr:MAG: hypothetical protein EAY69_09595 [Cytophagales bacterium]TAH28123.1 MAG: hypothetical protein EAZ06_11190 [Cytophagales bacterium]